MSIRKVDLNRPERLLTEPESYSHCYAKFIAEPFERGFGVTLGNAMRRVLLSFLRGAAITSVKIDGVLHEFSTIPGVVEDVTQIVLNLKEIRFRSFTNDPVMLTLDFEGEGEVTAADIKPSNLVEVVNPDQHIATLGTEGRLHMEMEVSSGRGYIPYDLVREMDHPPGVIPIDAMFSPVRRVNFRVEETRVGQMTNYDRLILEVWTDGSITPKEAITSAAEILQDYLNLFVGFSEDFITNEPEIDEDILRLRMLLSKPVSELDISVRAANCLEAANIITLGDLVTKTESEMMKFRNFGKKSLQEIKEVLEPLGLSLGMRIDEKGNLIPPPDEEVEEKENGNDS